MSTPAHTSAARPREPEPTTPSPAGRTSPARRPPVGLLPISLIVILGYAAVRTWWQLAGPPPFRLSPIGDDLVVLTGWPAVLLLLCGAGVAAVVNQLSRLGSAARRAVVALAAALGALMICTAAMLMLDVVAFLFPGIGVERFPIGLISRLAMAASGVLLLLGARTHWRSAEGRCISCGDRTGGEPAPRPTESPRWAYVAAYLTVLGCLVRVGAQVVVGMDSNPLVKGPMILAFEAGFLLAGVLLPLALVHRWGRVWPFWVPFLAQRRIPRWLVLGPGAVVGVGMVAYFGMMITQMVEARLQGRNPFPPSDGMALPETFFWVSVPAYLIWGVGLTIAARSYAMITRPPCRRCGE